METITKLYPTGQLTPVRVEKAGRPGDEMYSNAKVIFVDEAGKEWSVGTRSLRFDMTPV